jgi:hypothetical protein
MSVRGWLFLWACLLAPLQAAPRLFLSDNHAESFTWFAQVLDLDEPVTLVLIDHHSDASWAERSDDIRDGLQRVRSLEERRERCEAWRQAGRIQAYNWIEPLMPSPFQRVVWIPRESLSAEGRRSLLLEAQEQVDGREEFEQRSAGSLAKRWSVAAAAELPKLAGKLAASVDLDYFMEMEPEQARERFANLWQWLTGQPGLLAISFSLSRPWLRDDAQAAALLELGLEAMEGVRGAQVTIHTARDTAPDTSRQFRELTEKLGTVPKWEIAKSSADIAAIFQRNAARWHVEPPALVDAPEILVEGRQASSDGVFRVTQGEPVTLRVDGSRVRWYAWEPAHAAVDLMAATGLGKSFSKEPASWVVEQRRFVVETQDGAWQPPLELGRSRFSAAVLQGGRWITTPVVEVRCATQGGGFRAGLAECFRMPYIFGISQQADAGESGVETGWGSDCASFLTYAWRRNGIPITWGDPGRVSSQLQELARGQTHENSVSLPPGSLEQGVVVSFGMHMAALWEDREPLGQLSGSDLMVHHLGQAPEVISLEKLAQNRPAFSVYTPQQAPASCVLSVVGDCSLLGARGEDVAPIFASQADGVLLNCEGIPSQLPVQPGVRVDIRFSPSQLDLLKHPKLMAVGLENNHTLDAGLAGLADGLAAFRMRHLPVVRSEEPLLTESKGVRLAIFAVDCLQAKPEEKMLVQMGAARKSGRVVLVLVHWGRENTDQITAEQRSVARQLQAAGAHAVLGSHPHVLQSIEWSRGGCIAYSLGNAVWPKQLGGALHPQPLLLRVFADGRLALHP